MALVVLAALVAILSVALIIQKIHYVRIAEKLENKIRTYGDVVYQRGFVAGYKQGRSDKALDRPYTENPNSL